MLYSFWTFHYSYVTNSVSVMCAVHWCFNLHEDWLLVLKVNCGRFRWDDGQNVKEIVWPSHVLVFQSWVLWILAFLIPSNFCHSLLHSNPLISSSNIVTNLLSVLHYLIKSIQTPTQSCNPTSSVIHFPFVDINTGWAHPLSLWQL
jgi:hypothetical protein